VVKMREASLRRPVGRVEAAFASLRLLLRCSSKADGRYTDKVLTIHSNSPDDALAALDRLERPENTYRIVVAVGMLNEGWDVKNVYVIASLRASVSDILPVLRDFASRDSA
jgi:hypothetical protein